MSPFRIGTPLPAIFYRTPQQIKRLVKTALYVCMFVYISNVRMFKLSCAPIAPRNTFHGDLPASTVPIFPKRDSM